MNAPEFAASLPALPWSYQTVENGKGHVAFIYIVDANGRRIASLWGKPKEKIAVAELICDASTAAHELKGEQ